MELRQLKYFLAVAEELNFTRAAQRLHMAQPPLSQQVKALEAELGFPLFRRTTRRVELTPAGEYLAHKVQHLFAEVDQTVSEAREIAAGARGIIRIGFVGTASYHIMPEIMAYAREELPDVRVVVEGELLTPQIEERLKQGALDLAVIRPPVTSSEIMVEELRRDPFQVALPENDPLAAEAGPLDIAGLRDRDFVSYPANAAAAISLYAAASETGFLPHVVHQADRTSTLLTLVGAGAGIAVVPAGSVSASRLPVRFRPLTGIPPIGLAVSVLEGTTDPLIGKFSEVIRRVITRKD
ncbi:LysR family transcriptional regulator [Corynebacterium halotolerans]|uniref:LysR family transcriptional regulator n=1 Tax=Corynebacterium halotolerans YIM 70093 = DSM 44683 TaxID=1121362 RepID=M1NIA3_9CORY|nr:LysR substrate-binding domain-containing protein [Corynebacterium halotolerans]AGF71138.1 LysR family transcriptional regulator [Corynebacterium halotolerans YIM 70093 = DSM 44683]